MAAEKGYILLQSDPSGKRQTVQVVAKFIPILALFKAQQEPAEPVAAEPIKVFKPGQVMGHLRNMPLQDDRTTPVSYNTWQMSSDIAFPPLPSVGTPATSLPSNSQPPLLNAHDITWVAAPITSHSVRSISQFITFCADTIDQTQGWPGTL